MFLCLKVNAPQNFLIFFEISAEILSFSQNVHFFRLIGLFREARALYAKDHLIIRSISNVSNLCQPIF